MEQLDAAQELEKIVTKGRFLRFQTQESPLFV